MSRLELPLRCSSSPNPTRVFLIRYTANRTALLLVFSCNQAVIMVKTKQRQRPTINTSTKDPSSNALLNSSNSSDEEDSWVMVKKQRITILVPPLPVSTHYPTSNPGQIQLQTVRKKPVINPQPEFPKEIISPAKLPSSVPCQENSSALVAEKSRIHQPTLAKPLRQDLFKAVVKRPRHVHGRSPIVVGQGPLMNQSLRAVILERKLRRAGGLSRWLSSLGLNQFVKIFERRSINKFQLVHLTMNKLKDMGAFAVGPRRKLMHAIDCVCQPCCFESF